MLKNQEETTLADTQKNRRVIVNQVEDIKEEKSCGLLWQRERNVILILSVIKSFRRILLCFALFAVQGTERRALHMLGRCSTMELHLHPRDF